MCAWGTRGEASWGENEAVSGVWGRRDLGRTSQDARNAQQRSRAKDIRPLTPEQMSERRPGALNDARFTHSTNCALCVDILESSVRGHQGADSIDLRIILQADIGNAPAHTFAWSKLMAAPDSDRPIPALNPEQ